MLTNEQLNDYYIQHTQELHDVNKRFEELMTYLHGSPISYRIPTGYYMFEDFIDKE